MQEALENVQKYIYQSSKDGRCIGSWGQSIKELKPSQSAQNVVRKISRQGKNRTLQKKSGIVDRDIIENYFSIVSL